MSVSLFLLVAVVTWWVAMDGPSGPTVVILAVDANRRQRHAAARPLRAGTGGATQAAAR